MCETVEVCVWLDNIGADDQTECLIGNIDMWECDARNTVRQLSPRKFFEKVVTFSSSVSIFVEVFLT